VLGHVLPADDQRGARVRGISGTSLSSGTSLAQHAVEVAHVATEASARWEPKPVRAESVDDDGDARQESSHQDRIEQVPIRITTSGSGDPSKVVLWLDPHESVASYAPLVRQLDRQVTLRTSTEANMLMTTRSAVLKRLAAQGRFRIITNRQRAGAGGSMAGQQFCEWLREPNGPWHSVPVMLYCFDGSFASNELFVCG